MILNQKSKKSQTAALLTFITAGIIIAVFFAGWMFFFNKMTTTMLSAGVSTNIVNMTSAVNNVLVPINNAMSGLNSISVAILIGLIIGMFVEVYYVRKHPILFAVHLLVWIMSIFASMFIANQYETLMGNSLIGTYLTNNIGLRWLTLNLPLVVTIIGAFTLILMFIAINRDPEFSKVTL